MKFISSVKYFILSTMLLPYTLSMSGQMATWTIYPECDTIFVKSDKILQSISGGENTLWTMEGKKLFSTHNDINKFNNGLATIQNKGSNKLSGFVDSNGNFVALPEMEAAYGYPYFEDGFFVTKLVDNYAMFDKKGKAIQLPPLQALYPYSNGFATYYAFQQPEKKKNPFFNLLLSDGSPLKNFVVKENDKTKPIEPKDISFLSTVGSDTGRALAVVKNKLYWFDTFEMCLIPILMEDDNGKKKQLAVESNKALASIEYPIDSLSIIAKYGKDQNVEFRFDHLLRLLPKHVSAASRKDTQKKIEHPDYSSDITTFSDGWKVGLSGKNNDSIPSQFEKIGLRYGNRALARLHDKWGVIELLPDCDYDLKLNDGEDIAFRHRSVKSMIRIDLPARIKASSISIEIPESSGLHIDKSSRTENISFITYACTIDIPTDLPDSITEMSYGPVTVFVDQVRLPSREIKAKGWHIKHFTIEIPNEEATVSNGKAVFEILVHNEKEQGEKDYPFEVTLETDSMPSMTERISENIYRCTVDNLKDGINDITVKVSEKDCPGCFFPLEISYTVKRKKETATVRHKINSVDDYKETVADSKEETYNRSNYEISDSSPLFASQDDLGRRIKK